jgi:hypothetical protein
LVPASEREYLRGRPKRCSGKRSVS